MQDSIWQAPDMQIWNFIHPSENIIYQSEFLQPVFKRLLAIQTKHKGVLRIVHIGDSHLQADMMSSIVRNGIQNYFGNAGRGMVFPYQLAKSNAPADIYATSNIVWQYNRCAHPEISIPTGVSGFGIHSNQGNAYVYMRLKDVDGKPQYFNKLTFFLSPDSLCYTLTAPGINTPVSLNAHPGIDAPSFTYQSDSLLSEFKLARNGDCNPSGTFSFYGVSLERTDVPGIVYNTIGVNGAQYDQFTNVPLFWKQLATLKADMYIVSLGTNEAQNLGIREEEMMQKCSNFLDQIRAINPNAIVLITTPAGSYYKASKPNAAIQTVSNGMIRFCKEQKLPYWDLYHVSSGYAGAIAWKKYGLMSHDLVHYNPQGYKLQGQLFLYALAKAFNEFKKQQPAAMPAKTADK